jgi:hypothetical protein
MRETVGSLRAYLILSGIIGALQSSRLIGSSGDALETFMTLPALVLSLSYLYLGIRLPTLMATALNRIFLIFEAGAAYLIMFFGMLIVTGAIVTGFGGTGFGLLLIWYLCVNAKRLVAEAQKSPPEPALAATT